jgi:lipopolysaccharide transport system permease protein
MSVVSLPGIRRATQADKESRMHQPAAIASWDLLVTMVERRVRLRAKRTWIGSIWPVIAPLFLFVLYAYVFHSVFKVHQPHYSLFLFCGLLPWTFLAQTLGDGVQSISNEAVLVRRAAFHHEILPIAAVLTMSIYFLITLAGLIGYLAVRGQLHPAVLPLVVIPVLALYLLVSGLTVVLAYIDVYNRDLRQVLGNLLTVWFFLVPIVYSQKMVSPDLRFMRSIDPVSIIVGQFRQIFYYGSVTQPAHYAYVVLICGGVFVASLVMARRVSRHLAKDI